MVAGPRVLVVQSAPRDSPRRLGEWWRADGLELDIVLGYDAEPLPIRLDHDAIVVLGGGYLPDDDARAPWLAPTRALVRDALNTHRPIFGVCLGGQLLAHVAGGRVRPDADASERGSTPVRLRAEAHDDPLFRGLPDIVMATENHIDAIDQLPPGAAWLASTDRCPHQAFRVGRRAWGVQFHPEAPAADRAADPAGDPVLQALGDSATAEAAVWREVARRFARVVHEARDDHDH
ncbi:MAG TPA: type 1 glutamine amidotransferase [Jiangellaceae bacterium]